MKQSPLLTLKAFFSSLSVQNFDIYAQPSLSISDNILIFTG